MYPLADIVSPYRPLQNAMKALDGCFNNALDECFSTSAGLGAEWYKRACVIAIRHLCTTRETKKRQQKRARMRSSELSIV